MKSGGLYCPRYTLRFRHVADSKSNPAPGSRRTRCRTLSALPRANSPTIRERSKELHKFHQQRHVLQAQPTPHAASAGSFVGWRTAAYDPGAALRRQGAIAFENKIIPPDCGVHRGRATRKAYLRRGTYLLGGGRRADLCCVRQKYDR